MPQLVSRDGSCTVNPCVPYDAVDRNFHTTDVAADGSSDKVQLMASHFLPTKFSSIDLSYVSVR